LPVLARCVVWRSPALCARHKLPNALRGERGARKGVFALSDEIEALVGGTLGCLWVIAINGLMCAAVVALGLGVLRLLGCD